MLKGVSKVAGVLGAGLIARKASKESGAENQKALNRLEDEENNWREWYNIRMAKDYTQRSDVQAAIKRQRDLLNEQYNRARATNAVAGGTDEALALQKKGANQSVAQTYTDVAAAAAADKDNAENKYMAHQSAINQQIVQNHQQQAAQIAQAGSQAANAALGLVGQGIQANAYNKVLEAGESNEPQVVPTVNGFEVDTSAYNNAVAQERMAQISAQQSDAQLAAALAQNKKLRNQ